MCDYAVAKAINVTAVVREYIFTPLSAGERDEKEMDENG